MAESREVRDSERRTLRLGVRPRPRVENGDRDAARVLRERLEGARVRRDDDDTVDALIEEVVQPGRDGGGRRGIRIRGRDPASGLARRGLERRDAGRRPEERRVGRNDPSVRERRVPSARAALLTR